MIASELNQPASLDVPGITAGLYTSSQSPKTHSTQSESRVGNIIDLWLADVDAFAAYR